MQRPPYDRPAIAGRPSTNALDESRRRPLCSLRAPGACARREHPSIRISPTSTWGISPTRRALLLVAAPLRPNVRVYRMREHGIDQRGRPHVGYVPRTMRHWVCNSRETAEVADAHLSGGSCCYRNCGQTVGNEQIERVELLGHACSGPRLIRL